MIRNFLNRILQYYYATNKKEVLFQSKLRQEIEAIKRKEFKKDKKNLIPHGFKVFSQSDEDGILNEIFKRIGTTNKKFLEFGVNSKNNNTTFLCFSISVFLASGFLYFIRFEISVISENHDVSEKRPHFWTVQKIDPEISAKFLENVHNILFFLKKIKLEFQNLRKLVENYH